MEIRKYCRSIGAGDQEDFAAVFVAADDRNGARRDADQFGDESEQGLIAAESTGGAVIPTFSCWTMWSPMISLREARG